MASGLPSMTQMSKSHGKKKKAHGNRQKMELFYKEQQSELAVAVCGDVGKQ